MGGRAWSAVAAALIVHIEPAAVHDVPRVAALEQLAFSDPWPAKAFADLLGQDHLLVLVAREDAAGPPVGYVVAIFAGGEGEGANLAVAEECRGHGVGGRLVEAVVDEARHQGVEGLYLEVRESNAAARQLYESRGFEEVGRRRGYYRRPTEDALILRRTVEPGLV
ncbi:MAG: ribosomal protein S18-alanine N-acetyltransferase [Gemmatimonadaceae bacterium]